MPSEVHLEKVKQEVCNLVAGSGVAAKGKQSIMVASAVGRRAQERMKAMEV